MQGAATIGEVLNVKLHARRLLPIDDMRLMTYYKLFKLRTVLGRDDYNDMMNHIFDASIDVIKRKDKIKVGFVVYDSAMWCGDLLYRLLEQNERYEPTIFLCLRADEKSPMLDAVYMSGIEMFKRRKINVVGVKQNNAVIPKQDVFIYLTPYFEHLPTPFKMNRITAESLITYIPYSIGVGLWGLKDFSIYFILWKMFAARKNSFDKLINSNRLEPSRVVYSGHPKTDIFFFKSQTAPQSVWKMTRPDAVKIIWAPHWSITGGIRYATFQWNYKFFYEYAKAHPEISWIVKPHPHLLYYAVRKNLFSSTKEFVAYLKAWDELPNARVKTGGYYQGIFATSDGMILDSSSFVVEYQFTRKPLCFLMRSTTKFNSVGKKVIDANYHVDGKDFDGIKHFIEEVIIKKNDPQYEVRIKLLNEELNYVKDNKMLASAKVFQTIDQSFK